MLNLLRTCPFNRQRVRTMQNLRDFPKRFDDELLNFIDVVKALPGTVAPCLSIKFTAYTFDYSWPFIWIGSTVWQAIPLLIPC